jgi:Protein of unknown function (DUF2510)
VTETPQSPPPGWYANPEGAGQRYWDGANWTDQFSERDAQTKTRWGTSPAYWVACGSLVGMVVGGVGPWITLGPLTFSGTSGGRDGGVVVGAAVVAGILLAVFAATGRRGWLIGAGIVGLLMLITTIVDLADISDANALGASAGWGIWLALAASALLMVASIVSRQTAPPR